MASLLPIRAIVFLCCHFGASPLLASAPRERINFDFAWRFHLGDPSNAKCPPNIFPKNLTGIQCKGLTCDRTATRARECRAYDDSAWAVVDAPHIAEGGEKKARLFARKCHVVSKALQLTWGLAGEIKMDLL